MRVESYRSSFVRFAIRGNPDYETDAPMINPRYGWHPEKALFHFSIAKMS